ncbi:hypothetical protein AKJ38_02380 [candidate division MSBL1 archaeon SCGC-AAA259I14]|uniref:Uncharacterized protein n=1 Tax=candidate division MSBL1 archaeon SCGC-AAA259I14 TaxID=1698268 RepID=A0A133URM2_9EURY|nr:hypothetical protein AKJ38_02380 [candidate division MSBL1 archaeon SCGC-AAA259I14]
MVDCKFDMEKKCPFEESPDDPGWCQACAILELSSAQRMTNKLHRVRVLYELRETFLETLPYQRPDLEDKIKERLIELTENLEDTEKTHSKREEKLTHLSDWK